MIYISIILLISYYTNINLNIHSFILESAIGAVEEVQVLERQGGRRARHEPDWLIGPLQAITGHDPFVRGHDLPLPILSRIKTVTSLGYYLVTTT